MSSPGFLVRWVNPGDWLAVIVKAADSKAWVYKRVNDGILQSPLSSGSTVSLTNGNWYTGKVVVGDDLGNSALQRLRFWIDTDDDGTWSDETALLDTTTVDDDWSAGHTGLFHGHIASTAAQDFDDVKIGLDLNADLDLDDTADSLVINDDFASNSTTLSYDDNGNLTDDGIFKFVYDAWNRLVLVKSRYTASTTQTTFATYAYDGANRRNSKVVANSGVEVYPNDGGNTTVHFYYGSVAQSRPAVSPPWSIFETRNGSNQTTWQHLWGTQYIDELIWLDKNSDPTIGNDTDPDGTAGEGAESPGDHRYSAHQDRNWSVVALTDYGDGVNANVAERRINRTPHGAHGVNVGAASSGELGATLAHSGVGTAFGLHGLLHDHDKDSYQNRRRDRIVSLERFAQRDPSGYVDGMTLYRSGALGDVDPLGLCRMCPDALCECLEEDLLEDDVVYGVTTCDSFDRPCSCVFLDRITKAVVDPVMQGCQIDCTLVHECERQTVTSCPDHPDDRPYCEAYVSGVTCLRSCAIDNCKNSPNPCLCLSEAYVNLKVHYLTCMLHCSVRDCDTFSHAWLDIDRELRKNKCKDPDPMGL